ncbi:hypothetical protein BER93_11185 [Xanthomonas fragariae]|nr:hypothetical protein BER92_11160 [Xanthomonas fragariae]AOD18594.1 hypothetical protein BER93_11185 [Xanthomonas fragariae]
MIGAAQLGWPNCAVGLSDREGRTCSVAVAMRDFAHVAFCVLPMNLSPQTLCVAYPGAAAMQF